MRREVQSVLLFLVGGTMVKIGLTGTYVRYVRVGLGPYLIAAGVVLVVVGLASLCQPLFARADVTPPAADGHQHGHGRFDVVWLLLAPVFALLVIAPPALGSYAASRSGTDLRARASTNYPPLPDGDPVRLSVLDYATRAVFDQGRSLGSRTVTMSGFLVADDHGGWYLTRMVIMCCAADARPIKVGLAGDLAAEMPGGPRPDAWVQVTGRYTAQTGADAVNHERIPYVRVLTVEPIPAPAHPYEA
jgi:uncharacterized repeat protein (TIGR03943 family)